MEKNKKAWYYTASYISWYTNSYFASNKLYLKNHQQCLILAEIFWEKNTLASFPASISQGALNKADTDGLLILKASTASHSISAWSLDGWGNKGGKRENYSCMPMWKCSLISSEISEDDSNGALKKSPGHSSSTMGPFWREKKCAKNIEGISI